MLQLDPENEPVSLAMLVLDQNTPTSWSRRQLPLPTLVRRATIPSATLTVGRYTPMKNVLEFILVVAALLAGCATSALLV